MVKKVKISDLSEISIVGGQIISRIEAKESEKKNGTIKVLVPKAISNGFIDSNELGTIDFKTDIDQKRITKEGDIVIKLSTPYDACLITKEDEGLLVPSFCAIIRNLPSDILKTYLVAFLNSKACLVQIKTLVTGSTIAILSSTQIKKITLPVPGTVIQEEIANEYIQSIKKIKLLEKITRLEKEYIDSRFLEMEE